MQVREDTGRDVEEPNPVKISPLEFIATEEHEAYLAIRKWRAYGNGILVKKGDELCAYPFGGKKIPLVGCLRDDASSIGREWNYEPYSRGAVYYDFCRSVGHEGMEIDSRTTITAYADTGERTRLYGSQDDCFRPQREWKAWKGGVIVAERCSRQEWEFTFHEKQKKSRVLYRGKSDSWRCYGGGIVVRQGNAFIACTEEGKNIALAVRDNIDSWCGYGKGIIAEEGRELRMFRENGGCLQLFRLQKEKGRWQEKRQYKPCHQGIVICSTIKSSGSLPAQELALFTDEGKRQSLYQGTVDSWDIYESTVVIERREEKHVSWVGFKFH